MNLRDQKLYERIVSTYRERELRLNALAKELDALLINVVPFLPRAVRLGDTGWATPSLWLTSEGWERRWNEDRLLSSREAAELFPGLTVRVVLKAVLRALK